MASKKKKELTPLEQEFKAAVQSVVDKIHESRAALEAADELANKLGVRVKRDGTGYGIFGNKFDPKWDDLGVRFIEYETDMYCYDDDDVKASEADWSDSYC